MAVLGGLAFADIAAGSGHTCGLLHNGSVACWVGASGWAWVCLKQQCIGTWLHWAGLKALQLSKRTRLCDEPQRYDPPSWPPRFPLQGWNDAGQLGDGSNTDRLTPTLVDNGRTFMAVAAGLGSSHTLFLP